MRALVHDPSVPVGLRLAEVAGRLDPHVGLRRPWSDHEDAVEALLGRRVAGKVVLDVS